MEFVELKTEIREGSGKGVSRELRRNGLIPGIVYGKGVEPVMLSVAKTDLDVARKTSKTAQVFVTLNSDSDALNGRTAMIAELQMDPLTYNYQHIDLYEVSTDRKVKVKVPVTTKGLSEGVDLGGMLQVIRRELEIVCKPQDVPECIELDVTALGWGDAIHVADVDVEGDIEIPYDVNFTVVTVLAPKGAKDDEEELEGEEAEGEEAAAEGEEA